ncbi:MAG: flagellar motor switch phosphatase FliY [Armatimonadetes bacterium]|nr:flagellar motor switch phosphatase FliY [Armatimonadota bacterium]
MTDQLSMLEQDALANMGNMWMDKSADSLSLMLNKKTVITNCRFSYTTKEELTRKYPGARMLAEVKVQGFGTNHLMFQAKDAAVIVDLIIGGSGKGVSTDFSELHISIIEETANEMTNGIANLFGTITGNLVGVEPGQAHLDGFEGIEDETLASMAFSLKIEDLVDSEMLFLMAPKAAENMAVALLNPQQPEAPAQAAPPPPPPPPLPTPEPAMASAAMSAQATAVRQAPPLQSFPQPQISAGVAVETPAHPAQFSQLAARAPTQTMGNLDLILDVPLQLTAVLGRTGIMIKDLIELGPGSVLELDKLAGEPVELLVNNKMVARGEVVVIDEKFGVRITETISQVERIRGLKG